MQRVTTKLKYKNRHSTDKGGIGGLEVGVTEDGSQILRKEKTLVYGGSLVRISNA